MNDKIAHYRKISKEYMIPFYGVAMNANIQKDPERIFCLPPFGSFQPVWILPLANFRTSEEVNGCLREFIKGRVYDGTGEGRTCWTSPIGLILLEKEEDPALREGDLRRIPEFDGWMFPKLEWLIDVLERKVFLQYVPQYSIERLDSYTDAAVEARRLKAVAEEEARLERQKKLLIDAGSPVTDETLALAKEVMSFDVYYDYSDNHKFCISYRQYERELRAKLKAHGMEVVLDNYIRSVVNRTA